MNWTTTSQHYTATFDYTSKTDNACRVTFNLGGVGVNVPYKATITNLSLVKISGGSSSSTGSTTTETTVAAGTNMAADASKFSGWANTEGGASASFKNLSNGLQIAVNNSGSDVWHVQGMYPDITLERGATYEISFDYQANKSVDMGYKFQQNYNPYDQYFNAPLSFTTQKQHYSKTFAMTEPTDDNVACVFTCGGVNTPVTVTITDLVIKKIS